MLLMRANHLRQILRQKRHPQPELKMDHAAEATDVMISTAIFHSIPPAIKSRREFAVRCSDR
jgi:hypothetical protein